MNKRILIVDDEEDLRNLLSQYLSTTGYDIHSAEDGEKAIEALYANTFDVVLLDIQMPKVGGIEVLKYISQHTPQTKVIILTGYGDLKNAMEARQYGASDFINKPYKLEDILSTIERVQKG
jgi:DNA-binding NtrC family response regulator